MICSIGANTVRALQIAVKRDEQVVVGALQEIYGLSQYEAFRVAGAIAGGMYATIEAGRGNDGRLRIWEQIAQKTLTK